LKKLTGLLTDSVFLKHNIGNLPANTNRLSSIVKKLQNNPIWEKLEILDAVKTRQSMMELIHDRDYLENLKQQITNRVSYVGTKDCVVCDKTFEVLEYTVGGCLKLVKQISSGELQNGFALVPGGHHAEKNQATGFCFVNNIAICAEYLIKHENYKRILIIDIDAHHGNGAHNSFYDRKDVFVCNIHAHPDASYPGTGYEHEIGKGEGKGYTLNIPMYSYANDKQYIKKLNDIFIPAWRKYQPEFILISNGYDAHKDDYMSSQSATALTYKTYTEAFCEIASEFCNGKLVLLFEGGYNHEIIPKLALMQLEILLAHTQKNT
jgi:acetoin utilization deacetylase AcuC-like enzyme